MRENVLSVQWIVTYICLDILFITTPTIDNNRSVIYTISLVYSYRISVATDVSLYFVSQKIIFFPLRFAVSKRKRRAAGYNLCSNWHYKIVLFKFLKDSTYVYMVLLLHTVLSTYWKWSKGKKITAAAGVLHTVPKIFSIFLLRTQIRTKTEKKITLIIYRKFINRIFWYWKQKLEN